MCDIRPQKVNPNRVRLTVGGTNIEYGEDCGTPTADMTTTKILLNSVLSTKEAKFMTLDIKNMYLQTNLDKYECLRIPESLLSDEMIELYNLQSKIQNGWIFSKLEKECTASHRQECWHIAN